MATEADARGLVDMGLGGGPDKPSWCRSVLGSREEEGIADGLHLHEQQWGWWVRYANRLIETAEMMGAEPITGRRLTPEEQQQGWAVLDCGCHATAVRPGVFQDLPPWGWEYEPHEETGTWVVRLDWLKLWQGRARWRSPGAPPPGSRRKTKHCARSAGTQQPRLL